MSRFVPAGARLGRKGERSGIDLDELERWLEEMNHSQSPLVELEELTIGEIRRALTQGGAEETLREALARLVETDEADRRSVAG